MYAFQMDVQQPIEMYDRVHAELVTSLGKEVPDGCLMHMVTEIPGGFRITEAWDSHEQSDRFGDEVMRPTILRVAGEAAVAAGPPPSEELQLHNLQLGTPVPTGV
jgi:hypothetical protein